MSRLLIHDLSASVELDRAAMTAVRGGSTVRRAGSPLLAPETGHHVIDFPHGFPAARREASGVAPFAASVIARRDAHS